VKASQLRLARRIPLLLLAALAAGCLEPSDQRPGFALRGEKVAALPQDWAFSDAHPEVAVQVATPYVLPHSVTIWCAQVDGALYLGARDPETKSWPGWVDDHPEVRLKIGNTLYDVRLEPVSDEARLGPVRKAYADKYDLPAPGPDSPPIRYWVVKPRT